MTVAFIVLLFFANIFFLLLVKEWLNVEPVALMLFQVLFVLTLILAELVTQQLYDESVFQFLWSWKHYWR